MLDRATRRAKSWADMQRPSPAGFIGRPADRHAADPDNLELAFLKIPNFVGLLEPLQDHIYIWSYRRVVAICSRRRYQFLNIAQPVLAEKDLVADKEGGRAKSTARYRTLRIVEQPRLDLGVLDQFLEAVGIEIGFEQGGAQYRWVVELFRFRPHIPVNLVDIALKHAEKLRRNGAAHDCQSIDGEERVLPELSDAVALQETRCFEALVIGLVFDAGKALGGGPVAGQFVDAAQQHRYIFEFRAGS